MITGIQITKAANDDLLNSFWLLDSEKGEARCIVAKAGFNADEVVAVSKLGEIEYREVPVGQAVLLKDGAVFRASTNEKGLLIEVTCGR